MKLVLGGPGAGKTTRLLSIIEERLDAGVAPEHIAFVSFTKRAVNEAIERASKKFKLDRDALPHFRTVHSLAYRELGLRRDEVLAGAHLKELGDLLGVKLSGTLRLDDLATANSIADGDRMLYLEGLARATLRPLADVWRERGEGLEFFRLKHFADTLHAYKTELGLYDFTGFLEKFVEEGSPLPVRVAIIDEAQDLTPLQWKAVEIAFKEADEIIVGGDDDQSIFAWSGADVEKFLKLPATETEVLPESHRLPRSVFELAGEVIGRVANRYAKNWKPRDDEGEVVFERGLDGLNLADGRSWLLLARNSHLLGRYERLAEEQGVTFTTRQGPSVDPDDARAILAYEKNLRRGLSVSGEDAALVVDRLGLADVVPVDKSGRYKLDDLGLEDRGLWHDAFEGLPLRRREYYLSVLRRGEKLLSPPKVHIDTIHGVKGGEADAVAVMTDFSRKTEQGFAIDPDNEHRVFYVGLTRARNSLHVIAPETSRAYPV